MRKALNANTFIDGVERQGLPRDFDIDDQDYTGRPVSTPLGPAEKKAVQKAYVPPLVCLSLTTHPTPSPPFFFFRTAFFLLFFLKDCPHV